MRILKIFLQMNISAYWRLMLGPLDGFYIDAILDHFPQGRHLTQPGNLNTNQSINQSSINQSINQSLSIKQSIKHALYINQSTKQSINQSLSINRGPSITTVSTVFKFLSFLWLINLLINNLI